MRQVILVMDDSRRSQHKPFAERYRVFDINDQRRAIEHAERLGFGEGSCFIVPFNLKPGVVNLFSCGDIDLKVVVLTVQE